MRRFAAMAGGAVMVAVRSTRMPRPHRIQFAGAVLHVTGRGNRRQPMYHGAPDYQLYLATLTDVIARFEWQLRSYCLMPNHCHMLLWIPEANLSRGMQRLHGLYAQRFNRRHAYDGHLFQGRFHSVLVQSHAHALELTRYIALNPVRAGLCSQPAEWPWSSYRAMVGAIKTPSYLSPEWVLSLFGDEEHAREALARFVHGALVDPMET